MHPVCSNVSKKVNYGRICAAWGCTNYQNIQKHVSYHKFPKDKDRAVQWARRLRRDDLAKKTLDQLRNLVVCSDHFATEQYTNANRYYALSYLSDNGAII